MKLPLDNVDTGRVNLSAAVQRCYDSKLWGESPWCDGSRRSVWQGPKSGSPDLMSEKVIIELPDELSRRAKLAAAGNRRLEDAVIDWINRAVSEPDVEVLPDDELLQLCDATFESSAQLELSGLLADAREGTLDAARRLRLTA